MSNFGGSAYAVAVIPSNMGGVAEETPPEKATALRCVLVHAPGADVPSRLRRALETKSIAIQTTDNIYAALADLCRLARDESIALPILALVEPRRIPHAADLVEAASAYAPNAVHWVYASQPTDRIREVREADLADWRREQDAGGGRTEIHPDSGGATHQGDRHSADRGEAGHGSVDPDASERDTGDHHNGPHQIGSQRGSVLTDEELDMLLADDPDEYDRPPDG